MSSKTTSALSNSQAEHKDYVTINDLVSPELDHSNAMPLTNVNISESRVHEEIHTTKVSYGQILFSWRWLTIILLHLGNLINMLPVTTMSMALLCMCGPVGAPRNDTPLETSLLFNTSAHEKFIYLENMTHLQEQSYEFSWDSETRGLLLSGYLFTVFLVPQFCNIVRRYLGNKLTLTIFTLVLAFLNLIGPLAARTSVHFLLAVRILTGLCINANIPISGDMLAWWVPAREKLTGATVMTSGWIMAGSLGPLVAGYFCSLPIDNGWPLIFYFNGAVTALWTVGWYCLTSLKPETHRFISQKEKLYILTHRFGMGQASTQEVNKTPYRAILTSRPFLAFLVSSIFNLWNTIITLICLPLYLTSVLQFSLMDTGVIVCVLSALRCPAMLAWSALGNWLLTLKSMSVTNNRKTLYMLSSVLASCLCLATSFLDVRHKWVAAVLASASVSAASCGTIMNSVIPLDMAPRYAGFLTGFIISVSCLVSITAPMFVSAVTATGVYEEWRVVWITMALVNLASGLVFLVFGSATLQPWAIWKSNKPTSITVVELWHVQAQGDVSETSNPRPPKP